MKLRITLLMLFCICMSLVGMEKTDSSSDQASKQLYGLLVRASNIVNKKSLLPDEGHFDPSEKSLLPWAQWLLSKRADPNYKLYFNVPMGVRATSIRLPTSMELAQKLDYKDIEFLFRLSVQKEKIK